MALFVTPRQLEIRGDLYYQLSSMITAGVTLPNALRLLFRNPPRGGLRPLITQLLAHLEAGESFTESLRRASGWIPAFDIALIQAGEKSGRLDACFALLATHNRDQASLMREIMRELLYPIFLVHLAILILPVDQLVGLVLHGEVFWFVFPKLLLLSIIYGLVGSVLFAGQGRRGENWRLIVERALGYVPMLGVARRNLALARLAAALEALLNAGVPTIEAWELAGNASGSPALQREVRSWGPHIEAGVPPSELMIASREFPEIFSHMYTTAEHSGKIDDTLLHLHAQSRENGMHQLKVFTRAMLIAISLIVSICIGYQIIKFWVNYFNGIFNATE